MTGNEKAIYRFCQSQQRTIWLVPAKYESSNLLFYYSTRTAIGTQLNVNAVKHCSHLLTFLLRGRQSVN
jgi:hypothetical protein